MAATIPFTQYHLPNGRKTSEHAPADPETVAAALELIAQGVHFDAEVLSTGMVSFTAELDDLDDPVLAIKVFTQESPEQVAGKVTELVHAARLTLSVRKDGADDRLTRPGNTVLYGPDDVGGIPNDY